MLSLNEIPILFIDLGDLFYQMVRADSLGRPYNPDHIDFDEDDLVLEKVSLSLVDDLTVGDAVNFFSLHEAPYRPFLTYRARIALDGPLVHAASGTTVNLPRLQRNDEQGQKDRRYVSPKTDPIQHLHRVKDINLKEIPIPNKGVFYTTGSYLCRKVKY